jgi:ribose/xylose/arabinose/galactoside ABC-type transport system permease subunit
VVVPAPSHGDTGATHTERIPIRTHSSARSDAVTESDATTEVTPAARASDAESDTADLPPVGAASTATGVAAAPETASAETASADTYSTGEPLGPPRDPVLVHLLWEGLLLVTLIGLAVAGLVLFPEFRSFDAARRVLAASVFIGIPAMAFSLSLRGAVPNLAVVPLAALGGSVFAAAGSDQGVASGVLQAATLTGIVGLVMGALVVGLRVPSWAASIAGALLAAGLAPIIASGPDVTPPSAPGFLRADWPMFVVFAVLSVGTGLLCLVPRVRRTLGAYREDVELGRRGLVAGFAALAVLIVSSAVAGLAGVLTLLQTNVAGSAGGTGDLLFPLAAVLLGGASVYGRRVGVAGTLLGVLILVTVQHLWLLSGVGAQYSAYGGAYALAGVAAIVGLLATPLVEWAGRRAEARSTT